MKTAPILMALCCASLVSCATPPGKDPLQNTKKLAAEGHATLYNNGAFAIPMTTIHIIPPGPDAIGLASEMAGMRARQSLEESVKHARESVGFTQAGIKKSGEAALATHQITSKIAGDAREVTRFGANMAGSSPRMISDSAGASITYAGKTFHSTMEAGDELAQGSLTMGGNISEGSSSTAVKILTGTIDLASSTSKASLGASGRHASYAGERFVKGYAAVPAKLKDRGKNVAESASLGNFVKAYQSSNEWRAKQSGKFSDIFVDTTGNYTADINASFREAGRELSENSRETGYTLALLKSLRWVMQGILWDATIKPVGKITGASLGYISVNAVAFPALVTVKEGVAIANVAVQVTWNSAASAYEITAPSATAAVVGLFSVVEMAAGQVLAGGELVAGSAISAGTYGVGKTTAAATATGGYVAGKTVKYIGAPLSSIGVLAGGSTLGVVAGTATAVTGSGLAVAGVAGEAATQITGNLAAGTVLVGGSTVSVVAGTALGTYELAKAVVVPAGYELGAGLVLGYGTLSQLSAQAVLAVADASYMVLSLEGPNWVLYAVKGNVDKGENLPQGAIVDLKAMQKEGESFIAVPVSDEELKRLVNSLPEQLSPETLIKDANAL